MKTPAKTAATKTPRWMQSTLEAAKTCETTLPWERGARRAAMIARRKEAGAAPVQRAAA